MYSLDRPIPLKARRDLVIQSGIPRDSGVVTVKDPVAMRYWHLPKSQLVLLRAFEKESSLSQLLKLMRQTFPERNISLGDIKELISYLFDQGLLHSARVRPLDLWKAREPQNASSSLGWLKYLLFIRLPGVNPARVLKLVRPLSQWLLSPTSCLLFSTICCLIWLSALLNLQSIVAALSVPSTSSLWVQLGLIWIALGATKVFHELAHAVVCQHFGAECKEVGVAFMLLSPCLYCDVSDAWLLPRRRDRIMIALAGPFAEIALATVAVGLWLLFREAAGATILLHVALVSTCSSVMLNLNPLLKYDGYYILSDLLQIANLRSKADAVLAENIVRFISGAPRVQGGVKVFGRTRWLLMIFSVLSMAYRWIITVGIVCYVSVALSTVGLQFVAILLGSLYVLGSMLGGQRIVRRAVGGVKGYQTQPLRIILMAVGMIGIVYLGLCAPVPWLDKAPLLLEPAGVRHIYMQDEGRVRRNFVGTGTKVTSGQEIIELDVAEDLVQLRNKKRELQWAHSEVEMLRLAGDESGAALVEQSERIILAEIALLEDIVSRATIRAPVDGTVMLSEEGRKGVNAWPKGGSQQLTSEGQVLQAGRIVCSIAPTGAWQAVVFVGEEQRNKLAPGAQLSFRLDGLPGQILDGRIVHVGSEGVETVPQRMSKAMGGHIQTRTNDSGQTVPERVLYRVVIRVNEPVNKALAGMSGVAVVTGERESIGRWMWRKARDAVVVRM